MRYSDFMIADEGKTFNNFKKAMARAGSSIRRSMPDYYIKAWKELEKLIIAENKHMNSNEMIEQYKTAVKNRHSKHEASLLAECKPGLYMCESHAVMGHFTVLNCSDELANILYDYTRQMCENIEDKQTLHVAESKLVVTREYPKDIMLKLPNTNVQYIQT